MESKVLKENGISNAGAANLGEELSKLLSLNCLIENFLRKMSKNIIGPFLE